MVLVLIGFGACGKSVAEMLALTNLVPRPYCQELLIIEPKQLDNLWLLKPFRYRHIQTALTPENMNQVLDNALTKGDIVIDLSVNVDALQLMACCERNGCCYVNASCENWEIPNPNILDVRPEALVERSLYGRIVEARKLLKNAKMSLAADAAGMNPGLVSFFVLKGLREHCKLLQKIPSKTEIATLALKDIQNRNFAAAAQKLGLRVIHITEIDSQKTKKNLPENQFWNTWSAQGAVSEFLDCVQVGFGTHEKKEFGVKPSVGPQNVRLLPVRGMDHCEVSFSPSRHGEAQKYVGFSVQHGESNSLSYFLTTKDKKYRPTVTFIYRPCKVARVGLARMRKNAYCQPEYLKVLNQQEIASGSDAVGALLMFEDGSNIWSGTILDMEDMSKLGLKFAGPTTVQVAIAAIVACKWLINNPYKGFLMPEDLPFELLNEAEPWLGRIYCKPIPHYLCDLIPPSLQFQDFVFDPKERHVIVVGAGFSGLYAAWLLSRLGIRVTVLEQRKEAGGKARTMQTKQHGHYELGPSVFHTHQRHMMKFAKALHVPSHVLNKCPRSKLVFRKDRKELKEQRENEREDERQGKLKEVKDILNVNQMREGDEIAQMAYRDWFRGYETTKNAKLCTFKSGWQAAALHIANLLRSGISSSGASSSSHSTARFSASSSSGASSSGASSSVDVFSSGASSLGASGGFSCDGISSCNGVPISFEYKCKVEEVVQVQKKFIRVNTTKGTFEASDVILACSLEHVPKKLVVQYPNPSFVQACKVARSVPTLRVYVEFSSPLPVDFSCDIFQPDSIFRWAVKINEFILMICYVDGDNALDRFRPAGSQQQTFVQDCLSALHLSKLPVVSYHFAEWRQAFTILLGNHPLLAEQKKTMHRVAPSIWQTFLPHPTQQAWTEGHMIQAFKCVRDLL